MNIAVVAGAAITTAVITGALLVGDSMQESLKRRTLDRLGRVDQVLLNDRFFEIELVDTLAEQEQLSSRFDVESLSAAIILRGAVNEPSSGRRASGVDLYGIDDKFPGLFPGGQPDLAQALKGRPEHIFPPIVINETLQRELGVKNGEDLMVSFGRSSDVPRVSLLGRRDEADVVEAIRVTVTAILSDEGPGSFGLQARQSRPLVAYVDISLLQKRLDRPSQANAILVPVGGKGSTPASELGPALVDSMSIETLGLNIQTSDRYLAVGSRELVIRPEIEEQIQQFSAHTDSVSWPVLTYLANQIEVSGRVVPYSTVAAMSLPVPAALGKFSGNTEPIDRPLDSDQIVLNAWAAADLGAEIGDTVSLSYYLVGVGDELATSSRDFVISAIVEVEGLAADSGLTPDVPGVSGAEDMASWDPPFPVELSLIRPQDEDYWDRYAGAPKAFVSLETGQHLWRSRYGQVTSIRLIPRNDQSVAALETQFREQLPGRITPEMAGFRWLAVRQQGLEASSGTTDFAGLFAGFSLFLIIASILLVALLFTLLVEQRAKEAGLLLAVGFRPKKLRHRMFVEGGLLAVLGAIAGAALALLYTRIVLRGLESWWAPIVESSFLQLHVEPMSLLVGALSAVFLVLLAIRRAIKRLSQTPARQLLTGGFDMADSLNSRSRKASIVVMLGLALAVILFALSFMVAEESSPALFFGIGAALVTVGISGFSIWCRNSGRTSRDFYSASLVQLAARNSARHSGRSLLSVALVACASFVLVSVTANQKSYPDDEHDLHSGTGGLALVAETDTALPFRLDSYLEQHELDLDEEDDFYSFRLLPGEDASCLNLYQPEKPRVLGVPADFVERGGFRFRATSREVDNPWSLLDDDLEEGVIPAIGDYNSVLWILHLGLGKDLIMEDELGREIRLRIVGLLDASIFQSELLISEKYFVQNFPSQSGFGYFLGSSDLANLPGEIETLEDRLALFGLDAGSTSERLAAYHAVENMYLKTFQALGGLGLILGTLGLAVVLLRNVIERQGELATLRAFGYRRARLARMVVAENAFLLAVGLSIGAVSGVVAVAPHLVAGHLDVPWRSLAGILIAVFAVGLLASIGAVIGSLRVPLLPALKAE